MKQKTTLSAAISSTLALFGKVDVHWTYPNEIAFDCKPAIANWSTCSAQIPVTKDLEQNIAYAEKGQIQYQCLSGRFIVLNSICK